MINIAILPYLLQSDILGSSYKLKTIISFVLMKESGISNTFSNRICSFKERFHLIIFAVNFLKYQYINP